MTPAYPFIAHEIRERHANFLDHSAWPKRPGHPDEFAAFVMSVAGNPMFNGEVMRLDGGLRMPAR